MASEQVGCTGSQHISNKLPAHRYFADRSDGLRRSSGEDLLVATV
jgi:hypothetical protein